MQGYGKSLFAGLKGCSCYMGQMVYQQQAKKGQPIRILCSIVLCYQRPTKALLWLPCYLICACLFMCHMSCLPMGTWRYHSHVWVAASKAKCMDIKNTMWWFIIVYICKGSIIQPNHSHIWSPSFCMIDIWIVLYIFLFVCNTMCKNVRKPSQNTSKSKCYQVKQSIFVAYFKPYTQLTPQCSTQHSVTGGANGETTTSRQVS